MTRAEWDHQTRHFDLEPDHGLRDPKTRDAWRTLLLGAMPEPPARVADIGCGTGTLTTLLTNSGFTVDGVDYSRSMIDRARRKAPSASFLIGDASQPSLRRASSDVVFSRHVLWAVPDPEAAVAQWVELLKPSGTMVLIEGRWHTGAGLARDEAERIVRTVRTNAAVTPLTDPIYWGGEIDDERYLLVSAAR